MTAGKLNLLIEQGATYALPLEVKDSGVSRDLTGYTARMMIKYTPYDTSSILTLTTENGRIVIDPNQVANKGKFSLSLTALETEALTFTNAIYDLELVNGSVVERLLQGNVKLSLGVTK